jgi:hypothetical protein
VGDPIKYIVVPETLADEEITEDLSEVKVIRFVVKVEGTNVVEVDGELVGKATAKVFGRSGHLLLHDAVILVLFGSSLETLPWEGSSAEVEQNVSKRLHVITTGLLCDKLVLSEKSSRWYIPTPRWVLMEA